MKTEQSLDDHATSEQQLALQKVNFVVVRMYHYNIQYFLGHFFSWFQIRVVVAKRI